MLSYLQENHPYAPPFIRVISPIISSNVVLAGGAMGLELLTPQGWKLTLVEKIIEEISLSLVKDKARILLGPNKETYSLDSARQNFANFVQVQEQTKSM